MLKLGNGVTAVHDPKTGDILVKRDDETERACAIVAEIRQALPSAEDARDFMLWLGEKLGVRL